MSNARDLRFCLGTADLGMDYGIASLRIMPTEDEAKTIIQMLQELGVRSFLDFLEHYHLRSSTLS